MIMWNPFANQKPIAVTLGELALQKAITQLGNHEQPKGSNSGPEVTSYLKRVGLNGGYPWCMAFVYWCVDEACKELGLSNPLVKTGGVMRQYDECTLRKLPKTSVAIKPGDIFIMKFSHGTGHTGIIEKVYAGTVTTIEGNTNDDGSREGYEVARMTRAKSSLHGIIQIP